MTFTVRKLISRLLDRVLEPLLCRIDDRQRARFGTVLREWPLLRAQVDEIFRSTYQPILSRLAAREVESTSSLPFAHLAAAPGNIGVLGFFAAEVAARFPAAVVLPSDELPLRSAQSADWPPLRTLLLLDEFWLLQCLNHKALFAATVADSIVFATRFELLSEDACRTILHEIGFIEISRVATDILTDEITLDAVSHPQPISCHPVFVGAPAKSALPPVWLLASRTSRVG